MAKISNHVFSTNSRVIREFLTQYKNTFYAFCELINNAIQAASTAIDIKIDYARAELTQAPIKGITIKDNGTGVALSDFDKKILEIGTDVKKGGKGVGRFAALQIGSQIEIETVGHDAALKKYTKVNLPVNSTLFENRKLMDMSFPAKEEVLAGKHNTYYQVNIKSLHHNQNGRIDKKNAIARELLEEHIRLALFEQYPNEIFGDGVKFTVNKKKLVKSEFTHGEPVYKAVPFTDVKGNEHKIEFTFYGVKLADNKVKVLFQVDNGGLKTIANTYSYTSEWLTQEMGSWYIYIDSALFTPDLFRNIDMDELGDEGIDQLKSFARDVITDFFISINKTYETFTHRLREAYPAYMEGPHATSETQQVVFEKFAFITEQKFKLLEKDNKIKDVLYPLMERAIADGNIVEILDSLLKTDKETTDRFRRLLAMTDMESIVHFNSEVAEKLEFLDFLHELNYGKIAEYVLERKQLHKIVEKHLWLFGESYNGVPNILWSDKKLLRIFEDLRSQYMEYEPAKEDENMAAMKGEGLNDITDLFFTNERPLDDGSREFMIVELKAPKCRISQKELAQIKRYAFAVESTASIPKQKTRYKLLLIAADITAGAKSEVKSLSAAYKVPFLIERKQDADIEIYLMTWAELIHIQKAKLNYLSKQLKIRDKTVRQKFEEEYPHLINQKMRTVLKKVS